MSAVRLARSFVVTGKGPVRPQLSGNNVTGIRTGGDVMDMAVLAGSLSTAIFVGSALPMLLKAARTRDLDSYSRGQLVLSNLGNAVNSVYVFSLPLGPIWLLHAFNLVCTMLMLAWHLQYAGRRPARAISLEEELEELSRSMLTESQVDGHIDGRIDGHIDGQVDGHIDGRIVGRIHRARVQD